MSKTKKIKPLWFMAIILLMVTSIGITYFLSFNHQGKEVSRIQEHENIRLIIMPLQPEDSTNWFYGNTIAYDLLDLFANMDSLDVVGPTTTQNITQETLYDFLENSNADYLINGKFSDTEKESTLLIEIIRNSDKAHVWVETFLPESSFKALTQEIYMQFSKQVD